MTSTQAPERRTLLYVMLAAVSLLLLAILAPFHGTLLWSVIVALLFTPVYRRLLVRLRGRRTPAALITVLLVVLIVVLPFVYITAGLVAEANAVYERLQAMQREPGSMLRDLFGMLPPWLAELLRRFGLDDPAAVQRRLAALLGQGGEFIANSALSIGQNTFEILARLLILLYVAFFLIRDGDSVVRALRAAVPLSAQDQAELSARFTTVIRATVKGNLVVASLQGALGGLAFWVLGVSGALLWGVLMAFLSLLPAVGAALVWVPVAIYLLVSGATWQGLALIAWGAIVIGLVDNLLRPILVGKDTRLPDYVVLIATLGGMAVFGINGFVLGPVIAAMFAAVWHIVVTRRRPVPPADAAGSATGETGDAGGPGSTAPVSPMTEEPGRPGARPPGV